MPAWPDPLSDMRAPRASLYAEVARMITIGLDPHPDSHTVAALDANGAFHGTITVPNDAIGLEELLGWSHSFPERR